MNPRHERLAPDVASDDEIERLAKEAVRADCSAISLRLFGGVCMAAGLRGMADTCRRAADAIEKADRRMHERMVTGGPER